MTEKQLPKIYAYINYGSENWCNVIAITEDGICLAQHASSLEKAINNINKQYLYSNYYPNGYNFEYISDADKHEGLKNAILIRELELHNLEQHKNILENLNLHLHKDE